MSKSLLESNILKTGTKFRVTEETTDTTFPPGTIGYVSAAKGSDRDYRNVLFMYATIIRRGKTGKNRLEMASLSVPIFDVNDALLKDKMPDEKRRNYVHMEPIKNEYRSIYDMSNMDYLGWAYANAYYLHLLSDKVSRIKVWSDDPEDAVVRMYRAREYFEEDADGFQSRACTAAGRLSFINQARKMEVSLVKCTIPYKTRSAELEEAALRFLMDIGIKDNGRLINTMDASKRRLKILFRVAEKKNKPILEE